MKVWVTGSNGLIGSAVSTLLCKSGYDVLGIDNDARAEYFGPEASTKMTGVQLLQDNENFDLCNHDIVEIEDVFGHFGAPEAVVHCAAQPSHDKAAEIAERDFDVNCRATVKLLEVLRKNAPDAVMIHMSTNKVYGDAPNSIKLVETPTRYTVEKNGPYANGIDEWMTIDQSKHSLFGASKLAADIYVQEYGRYFGMRTSVLRGGCLTGAAHAGAELHGFLQYLAKCVVQDRPYTVFGYKGKQVRDNIHATDVARLILLMLADPPDPGEVFNLGGGPERAISVLEAINAFEMMSNKKLAWEYDEQARQGDHQWYVSDVLKLKTRYPMWEYRMALLDILEDVWKGVPRG